MVKTIKEVLDSLTFLFPYRLYTLTGLLQLVFEAEIGNHRLAAVSIDEIVNKDSSDCSKSTVFQREKAALMIFSPVM